MNTLFVENLTVLDFSYLDIKYGILGESWIVDLALTGELDEQGFVLDFGLAKKKVKRWIDESIDHKLVVPVNSPSFKKNYWKSSVQFEFILTDGGIIEYQCPEEAVFKLDSTDVSIESVNNALIQSIKNKLPDNVKKVELIFRREKSEGHYYQYSHGLKKHDGNCQRMAHGHRSTIKVFENGNRSELWEKFWADRWATIYLGTKENIISESKFEYVFGYTSNQGIFKLRIPKSHCEILPDETTVECIANYLKSQLEKSSKSKFRVQAYEGVGKGAVSE